MKRWRPFLIPEFVLWAYEQGLPNAGGNGVDERLWGPWAQQRERDEQIIKTGKARMFHRNGNSSWRAEWVQPRPTLWGWLGK